MHHPFTSTHPDDLHLLDSDPGAARANAYDMASNAPSSFDKLENLNCLNCIA
jgi:hypothetical protein